jgi:group I intron endonuclease
MTMFVYAITNDVNDKAYVGLFSGQKLSQRMAVHRWDANGGSQIPLHRAMRKYGVDKFHITSIWSGHIPPENLKILEKYYIRCFQTKIPNGYNCTEGGDGSFGFKHSEETKQSIRDRVISETTRLKMSLLHKGKIISKKHREGISAKMKGNQHLLGHVHSAETRAKISAAGIGRFVSEETRAKKSRIAKERGFRPPQKSNEVNDQPRSSGEQKIE